MTVPVEQPGTVVDKSFMRDQTVETGMWNESVPGEKLLTKGEVAQLCRVEIRTVDRWVAAGKIKCYRIPSGRLLFRKQDVLMAAERQQEGVVQVTDDPVRSRNGFRVTTPVSRSAAKRT